MQQGLDITAWFLPFLIVIVLCIIGLTIWLTGTFSRTKNRSDAQKAQPVKQQFTNRANDAQPYVLAIRHSGTDWQIYVNGQLANTNWTYDSKTRNRVIEALRALLLFVRKQLHETVTLEFTTPETVEKPTPVTNVAGISRNQPAPVVPNEVPPVIPSTSVLDLAHEIGEIVDEMLAKSPTLQSHAVNLINAQTEGINFFVDGVIYNQVTDIPNAEIQELIRRATREWERR